MSSNNSPLSWIWKLAVCTIAYFVGTVVGGGLVTALSIEMPQVPGAVDPTMQGLLLIPAGLVFSIGLAAMATGLAGRWWERWLILTLFLWAINGVGNAIETTIFTTIGGPFGAALSFLPPAAVCSLTVALLFRGPTESTFAAQASEFFRAWKPSKLAVRIGLGILAFPIVYLFFGALVAPIVTPYYDQLDFLKIPPMSVLLPILHGRSALILLVTLPIIIGWASSRKHFILGLGLGNATAVGLGGLVQVTFFPAIMRWVHGVEILADGIAYGWILALLFIPKLVSTRSSSPELAEESV